MERATGTPTPTPIDTNGGLNAVACRTSTDCIAVDRTGHALEGDPTSTAQWSSQTLPQARSLTAAACPSETQCVIVDDTGHAYVGTGAPLQPQDTVSVAVAGTGTGRITGPGISCPSTCAQIYPQGTSVTLTATPASGSTFKGWSGACAGTSPCSITVTASQTVTATFSRSGGRNGRLTLTRTRVAGTKAIVTIDCSDADCGGTTLTLSVVETVKRGKVIAITAGRRKAQEKTVLLGRVTVSLSVGEQKVAAVPLNRTGRRLLASHHKLKAKLSVSRAGRTIATRTLAFKVKRARHKK